MKDTLLLYYSFEGNTEYVAGLLSKRMAMDVERLRVTKEPPKNGIGRIFQGGKSALFREDPGLLPIQSNLKDYYDIMLAFPIWAGTYPPAIDAFLKAYPFYGKNVFLVACSGSGDAKKAFEQLSARLSGNTVLGTLSLKSPLKNQKEAGAKIAEFAARRN